MASAAAVDLLFLAILAGVIAREILAGRNFRNLRVLALVGLLFAGNFVFHGEAILRSGGGYGTRLGIGGAILLITVIGGRIVPSFTRNWLARERRPGRLPAPFDRFDAACIATGAVAIGSWVVWPESAATAVFAILAGLLHAMRLVRW
jgi:uncharacterized protein involved in response to NO